MNRVTQKVLQRLADLAQKPVSALLELHGQAAVKGRDFLETGLKAKAFTAAQHQEALAAGLGLEYLSDLPELSETEVLQFTSCIPIRFAKAHRFFPTAMGGSLTLAVARPWPEEPFAEAALGPRV